ncbi:MAG: DEAD/DEAH box helicase [Elusimicrobiota bacterium]
MPFSLFNIHPNLVKAVRAMGFKKPTPIQDKAIPPALKGADVLGSAQTGSGKTVAFGLPLLHRLLADEHKRPAKEVRALILAPVRELAAQVEATLRDCARFTRLRFALVIGGESMRKQTEALRAGAEVVIATPGRMLDHLRNTRGFHLDGCRTVVLDEADRMLDMGFLPDVSSILLKVPKERQTLMFSATVPSEIERIVTRFMKDPIRIQIDPPRKPAEGVIQKIFPISAGQKYDLLLALIEGLSMSSVLVFTGTKRRADIVCEFLRLKGVSATALHSDLTQAKRSQRMDAFRAQRYRVLVATDIAARGLDIRHVSHVVNYDVPLYPEDYLHRIGRTARVFSIGDAITLMSPQEKGPVEAIETFVGASIERCALEGFPYDVPPQLTVYKRPYHSHFQMKRRSMRRGRRGIL